MMRPPTGRRTGTWRHGARKTTSLSMSARLRRWGGHASIYIDGADVERFSCFKSLGEFIKDDLNWSRQADSVVKLIKSLYFLRRLMAMEFGMSGKNLTNFYRCTIESILSGCITGWYASCRHVEASARNVEMCTFLKWNFADER